MAEEPEIILSNVDVGNKIKDFSDLLDQIETLSDKKRALWKEIYENAITDRQNAFTMFMKLTAIMADKSTEHAVHGKTVSSYIERMSKANDQLIRLAELIARAEQKDDVIDPEDMYSRMK